MITRQSATDLLVQAFLEHAKDLRVSIEPIRVLKARTYSVAESNVLIRAASTLSKNGRWFFGLNYIHAEEVANLDNPFYAFICGSVERVVILPAATLTQKLPLISHDRNGEYKINFDNDLNLVLTGRGNRLDCSAFINSWDSLLSPRPSSVEKNTAEESFHSIIQGRLLEIGNIRGFKTFCPNKSKRFNDRVLSEIATLKNCPELQFSEYKLLRQIDVLWFDDRASKYIPECAFEVELSTGVWAGVGRMATLLDYSNVRLYVVSQEDKKFQQVMRSGYSHYQVRYRCLNPEAISELYAAEIEVRELRQRIGL